MALALASIQRQRFTLHSSRSTLHASHFTLHASRFTLHASHFTLHAPHFTLHASRFTLHASHFTLKRKERVTKTRSFLFYIVCFKSNECQFISKDFTKGRPSFSSRQLHPRLRNETLHHHLPDIQVVLNEDA